MSRNKTERPEKERFICTNHDPDSCIFDFRPTKTKPIAVCPICGDDEFLSVYSGDKDKNVKEVRKAEENARIKNGKRYQAEKVKRQ